VGIKCYCTGSNRRYHYIDISFKGLLEDMRILQFYHVFLVLSDNSSSNSKPSVGTTVHTTYVIMFIFGLFSAATSYVHPSPLLHKFVECDFNCFLVVFTNQS
jgi:hypothetical protein